MRIILNNTDQTIKNNNELTDNDIKEFVTHLINQINSPETTYEELKNHIITFTPKNYLSSISLIRNKQNKIQFFDSQHNKKINLDIDFDWFLDQLNNNNHSIYHFNISRYIYKKMTQIDINTKSQYYIVADFNIIKEYVDYTNCVLIEVNMEDYVFLNNRSPSSKSIKVVVAINFLHPYYLRIYINKNTYSYPIHDRKWKKAFNQKLKRHKKEIKQKYQNPVEIFLSKNKK